MAKIFISYPRNVPAQKARAIRKIEAFQQAPP
jgi:hypothetical protein